ncbi:hypothetical protein CspeluHIS016_0105720 [Cutaneotrichosporon spelunceum]|uniref:YTH domain-containing protein n=1 Tax=Cutaneotrichosporon spelunceum TaxID=1672016 RepID=A0AAD3TPA4_9TREE|nr:hypothetical protein CspeluHIS016_0105720 [Cutaneotrichosporon spelunceum]
MSSSPSGASMTWDSSQQQRRASDSKVVSNKGSTAVDGDLGSGEQGKSGPSAQPTASELEINIVSPDAGDQARPTNACSTRSHATAITPSYADQAYGTLRPVYAPQIYYDPSIAAADYAVDPTHAYPGIPSRTSPGAGYPSQPPVPPQFHHAATTPPVPQGVWTGSPMPPQTAFFGSYAGMAPQIGTQHAGAAGMTDEMGRTRSIFLPHAAPGPASAWSPSSVMSSHYQFYTPYAASTERMENMTPVTEAWSPQTQARPSPARPPYVSSQTGAWVAAVPAPAPTATAAAAAAAVSASQGREHLAPLSVPGEQGLKSPKSTQPHQNERERERKEYHPQPPARRSEWVMWVGNVPSNVSHEELWRFFNTTTPPSAMSNPSEPWRGPSSIFLISRSSCAFVNFSSQADLARAVPFFHGLSLRPWDPRCPRMVCRVRHKDDDLRAGVGAQRGVGMHRAWVEQQKQANNKLSPKAQNLELPDHSHSQSSSSNHQSSASLASTNSSFLVHHFPKRFFILKSLTITDLEEAVKTRQWKTQRHNQPILDQAFRTSPDVYLIFGANRSGEFFGYAKMTAPSLRIRTAVVRPSFGSISSLAPLSHGHEEQRGVRPQQSTPTPVIREEGGRTRSPVPRSATDPYYRRKSTAFLHPGQRAASPGPIEEEDELLSPFTRLEVSDPPEDDAEGMFRSESPEMFEEALRRASVNTLDPNLLRGRRESSRLSRLGRVGQSSSLQIPVGGGPVIRRESVLAQVVRQETTDPVKPDEGGTDGLAPPFQLEWVKVAPLSFFRTRHLRNPWNGDREVKVSRDGTEVEPNVGQLLINEWDKLETEGNPAREDVPDATHEATEVTEGGEKAANSPAT